MEAVHLVRVALGRVLRARQQGEKNNRKERDSVSHKNSPGTPLWLVIQPGNLSRFLIIPIAAGGDFSLENKLPG
jgi:hypothetical protein